MTEDERFEQAHEELRLGRTELAQAQSAIDPVARRRCQVRAAWHLRTAANYLDDSGRLAD